MALILRSANRVSKDEGLFVGVDGAGATSFETRFKLSISGQPGIGWIAPQDAEIG
jgi:hypothetical protein